MYSSLSSESRETRIALLEPAKDVSSDITVRLVPASLDSKPVHEYEALSYVWGDANITKPICVNGVETQITTNLESALRSLRLPENERPLWIDALCINQRDITERNQQILHMQDVYSSAKRVIIWLGEARINTAIAMNFIAEHVRLDRGVINDSWLLKTLEHPNAPRAFRTMGEDLLKREWWKRIWVMQEISCARGEPIVRCGPFECGWNELVAALVFADRHHVPTYQFTSQELAVGVFHAPYREMSIFRRKHFLREPMPFMDLLQSCFRCEATDKRDHIFALLGLVTDHGEHELVRPDYSKPWQQVFKDLAKFFIERDKKLNIICAANHSRPHDELPSWVADWSDKSQTSNVIARLSTEDRNHGQYCYAASGESAADANISQDGNVLSVTGFGDDIVEAIGELMAGPLELNRIVLQWLQMVFGEEDPSNDYHYVGGGTMLEAFNRTICVDHDFYGHRPDPGSCGIVFNIELVPKHHHAEVADKDERAIRLVAEQRDAINHVAPRRRFFYTRDGFMGLGPPDAKEGDMVKILKGCDVPVLLRKDEEYFRLVGEAYVCGVMDGEMMNELSAAKYTLERFMIR